MSIHGPYTYRRQNGETFTIEIMIDEHALARNMAERMARAGKNKMKIADGAVIAFERGTI